MNRRMRSKWINTLSAIAVVIATIFLPVMESNAQWRLFGGWRNSNSSQTMMTCDPNTGICTPMTAAAPRPILRPIQTARYQNYTTTVASSGSSGSSGYATSNGSSGGVGSYGVVLQPGERLVSVSPPQAAKNPTKTLSALEDGSLLSEIMTKLSEDPNWKPGANDDPLLHAAYDFLEAYIGHVETGAFQRTALQPNLEETPTLAKPASPSLQGRITWQGPPATAGLAKKITWSPPALVASR